MDMQGSRALAVTQQQAWEALNDPEVLKVCIPGCEKIETTGPNSYTVATALRIGPVAAKFNGKINLSDVNPPESYTLGFDGHGGAAGFGKGTAKVKLTPSDTGCELAYTVNAQVGGKIAQVGQRLIDGVARSMADDFFKKFDEEMQRRYPVAAPEASAAPVADVAAAPAGAGGGSIPMWVWLLGGAVLVILAFAMMR